MKSVKTVIVGAMSAALLLGVGCKTGGSTGDAGMNGNSSTSGTHQATPAETMKEGNTRGGAINPAPPPPPGGSGGSGLNEGTPGGSSLDNGPSGSMGCAKPDSTAR